jgi:hypothetical protein
MRTHEEIASDLAEWSKGIANRRLQALLREAALALSKKTSLSEMTVDFR